MKTPNYHNRNVFIVMIACVLFLSRYAASQAMGSDAQSHRVDAARPVKDAARLIIRRIPNLGNQVIVDVSLDGVAFATIGYGHTYEGFLPPGRHVLSVLGTPSSKWGIPSRLTLDVRSGQTYIFTAVGDHSGSVILKGG
jgi:hypothetical protein